MALTVTVHGQGTFTASMEEGPVTFTAAIASVGPQGATGPTGPAGVVAATAPITYDSGTQTVAMDTSYFLRSPAVAGTDGQIVSWDAATSRPLWIDNAARTLFATVRNETGSTLSKGTVVYISGASGNKALVSKAQANNDANSAQTFAVISADLATNQNGTAIVAGELTGLNTSAYTEGAALYLSPTTAGAFTTTKPSAPNHLVYVATVVRSHATQGVIEVRIQNGYELEELHNVAISSLADKDLLAYDSATSLWKNRTASALDLATMTWANAAFAPAGWNPFDQTLNTNGTPQFTSVRVGALIVKPVGESPSYPDDYQFVVYKPDLVLLKADNLSGLASTSTARTNLDVYSKSESDALVPAASTTVAGKVELATDAEAALGTDTSRAVTPSSLLWSDLTPYWQRIVTFLAAQSGAGAGGQQTDVGVRVFTGTTSGAYALLRVGSNAVYPTSRGKSNGAINFDKVVAISGAFNTNQYVANSTVRFTFGKNNTDNNGNLARKGFGFRVVGTGAMELQVHDGTTLANVTSTFTPSANSVFDVVIISNAGTVKLYVNGDEVASSTGGPTGDSANTADFIQLEAETAAILAVQTIFSCAIPKLYIGR